MNTIRIGQDDLWRVKGPTDESAVPAAALTTLTSATGRLYDSKKDSHAAVWTGRLNADAAASATQITLVSRARLTTNDIVELELDDGTLHESAITSLDADEKITLTTALPSTSGAAKGRVLRRPIHAIGATFIEIDVDARQYDLNDDIEITTDDGTLHLANVDNRTRHYIELDTALLVAVSSGRRIARKIGGDITLTVYNSAGAAANTDDWGWQGIVTDTHSSDLKAGMHIRGEATLVDDDGGASRLIDEIRATVV
jgi:hypothetical protein